MTSAVIFFHILLIVVSVVGLYVDYSDWKKFQKGEDPWEAFYSAVFIFLWCFVGTYAFIKVLEELSSLF